MTTRLLSGVGERLVHYRKLSPAQEVAIRKARGDGCSVHDLAREYGVTARTIYRTLERRERPHRTFTYDDWSATFEMTDEGPVAIGPRLPA